MMSPLLSFVSSAFRSLFQPFTRRTFGASPVSERNVTHGTDWNAVYRDRYNYQRDTVVECFTIASLAVGDYIENHAFQASGGSLNVTPTLFMYKFSD